MKIIHKTLITLALSTLITACGGGGGENDVPNTGAFDTVPAVIPSDPPTTEPPTTEPPPVATGSASLRWDIPTTKLDGSPLSLSEIDGYRIYTSTTYNNFTLAIDITDGTDTQHTMTELSSGTHYFYVTTYDIEGNESPISNVVQKTII